LRWVALGFLLGDAEHGADLGPGAVRPQRGVHRCLQRVIDLGALVGQ
jgi:hypothetical protein